MSKELHGDIGERMKSASGVVLDLGPGTGEMMGWLDPRSHNESLWCRALPSICIRRFAKKIDECGLDGKYDILACGAEPESLIPELERRGILESQRGSGEGVFDTILCIRVLCGIPKQRETINEL